MFQLIEKALFAGIGTISLTRQKSEELINELQKQFNLSEEKGKELYAKMEAVVRENQQKLEDVAREEVRKSLVRMGVVTAEEFEVLRQRVQMLEQRLAELGYPPSTGTNS